MRKELLYFSDLPPLFILVIMEDLSEALTLTLVENIRSLNSCSNGRYSQSGVIVELTEKKPRS